MKEYNRNEERTGVQESRDWAPEYDVQSDFVMVYGFHNLEERIAHWKEHGYVIHLMTGVSWGGYQDYLYGKFDGRDHHDEGQMRMDGREINHGKDVPYMVPSISFARYLAHNLKKAVDAGVEAIHLEEPEFWVGAGYSEAFKREWQIYYNEPWQEPDRSAEGQYRASKLKRYLYTRTLDHLCSELKEYAMVNYGRRLRFYVPTHSLINYSQWRIVSPESALVGLPTVDGYIAQIWTGTSRAINCYRGERRERTFDTAFLEYGIMQELVRCTGRKMWYLHDPVEDNPNHTWDDYRYNYYRTLIASLFQPEVGSYEVAPWPGRVMTGTHKSADGTRDEGIPPEYKTNLLTVMHTLRDMEGQECEWISGNKKIGILLGDSSMFQRNYPLGHAFRDDPACANWSAFYGLALPLFKDGVCVRPVQLDNASRFPGYLNDFDTLVISYEFMKPLSSDLHNVLSLWVQDGGTLMIVGDGSDIFHTVREWWNTAGADYNNPTEHLYEALGLGRTPENGIYTVGKGTVGVYRVHPANIAEKTEICDEYLAKMHALLAAAGSDYTPTSHFLMKRGPYMIGAVASESVQDGPLTVKGRYVDLLADRLDIVSDPQLDTDQIGLWLTLGEPSECPEILAAAGRVQTLECTPDVLRFRLTGPSAMAAQVRVQSAKAPTKITVKCGRKNVAFESLYDEASQTTLLRFESSVDGVTVKITF